MLKIGKDGEDLAVEFLKKNGYRILARNYRCVWGELDIVAEEKGKICFVEVKTRASGKFGLGKEAIDSIKKSHLIKTALMFLKEKDLLERDCRFDVVSINLEEKNKKLELIKGAFELDS